MKSPPEICRVIYIHNHKGTKPCVEDLEEIHVLVAMKSPPEICGVIYIHNH